MTHPPEKTAGSDVCFEQDGYLGVVILNKPAALNALSVEMTRDIIAQLAYWQETRAVRLILITSSASRAFCAGGDVRQAVMLMQDAEAEGLTGQGALTYFTAEYRLDLFLTRYDLPVVSFVDGVVMGGGLGLCLNAGMTYFSQTIKLAMPETAIGLFPDVGARLFLRRAGVGPALMLGMTGTVIGTGDALALGMGEGCLPAHEFAEARAALAELAGAKDDIGQSDIAAQLVEFITTAPPGDLVNNELIVEPDWRHLFHGSPVQIRQNIENLPDSYPYKEGWLTALQTRCPLSIAAIHHIFTALPVPNSIAEALEQDFHLALTMTRRADFAEGVRAVLIDKDGAANWTPADLADITPELLDEIFDFSGLPELHIDIASQG